MTLQRQSCFRPVLTLASLFLLFISATAIAQTQLGSDIDGEAAEDLMGRSVSLSFDGNRLATGATNNDGNGEDSGHARVFQWSGTEWAQVGADIDGEAAYDDSGASVSLSADGNRLAIGAPSNDGNGEKSGHVRVYQWSGTAWTQLGSDLDGEAAGDRSGVLNSTVSLSSDGNLVAIGAAWNDGNGDSSGHVRVYQWSGTAWTQMGTDIDGEAAGDSSGESISLSSDGTRLAIGAAWNDGNGDSSGHVRVYQWSGTAWTQMGTDIDGEAADDHSGASVSLSSDGKRLAIGEHGYDGGGTDFGRVRVFQWSDMAWAQLGSDIIGEAASDYCCNVALSSNGSRLAVGSAENDGNGDLAGHIRVFQWSNADWLQIGTDIDGEAAGDYFGESVSLSSDGNRVAGGARWNDGNGSASGHTRVYDLSMFENFSINAGLNDAWYNPATNGQGFLITVFPEIQQMFLAWFTYDTERPPQDAVAVLGEPGHRWLTAQGPYSGDTGSLSIFVSEGGVFDAADPPAVNDGIADGTLTIEFADCTEGLVTYEMTSPDVSGEIPIQRITDDNVALCETLSGQ